ncbi:hypothetical protein F750_4699 [Streptomyces sp. PAMC 26508]|nr:hypothetical protein F750_4699 [Streptomyces sp. PAMC 26508]
MTARAATTREEPRWADRPKSRPGAPGASPRTRVPGRSAPRSGHPRSRTTRGAEPRSGAAPRTP